MGKIFLKILFEIYEIFWLKREFQCRFNHWTFSPFPALQNFSNSIFILGGQQGGAGVNGGQKKADVTKEMLDKQLDQYMQSSS